MNLQKLLFKLLCHKKLIFIYLAGVIIFSYMIMLEISNIFDYQYNSVSNWLSDECVLLSLILLLVIHLYNTYRNCLYFISSDIDVLVNLGMEPHKIKMRLKRLFTFSTIFIALLSYFFIWILFSINT